MKLRHIILSAAVILGFAACNDEDALTPNPDTAGVTYEFPEGNNAWDQDLQEIANEFGVKCIYKNLTLEDLTRSWTASGSGSKAITSTAALCSLRTTARRCTRTV